MNVVGLSGGSKALSLKGWVLGESGVAGQNNRKLRGGEGWKRVLGGLGERGGLVAELWGWEDKEEEWGGEGGFFPELGLWGVGMCTLLFFGVIFPPGSLAKPTVSAPFFPSPGAPPYLHPQKTPVCSSPRVRAQKSKKGQTR
ncbi:hypothetical protein ACTHS0_11745, partial [Neisseria sp. P0013.S009]|uniref:hypothetical protein n=1 Tax=Neisseria sp. P0013.S009 TaxID=3436745 RepID=UPI003F80FF81